MIRNATVADMTYVIERIRPEDTQEIEALTGVSLFEAIESLESAPYIALVIYRDHPIAVFGTILKENGVGRMFRFATGEWPTVVREAIKFGKRQFLAKMWDAGLQRLEAVTLDTPGQTAWLKLFGATPYETFERNGSKFVRFAIDRPANLS